MKHHDEPPAAPIPPIQVVLADPPWQYEDQGSRVSPVHEDCARGYADMTTRDIASLPVRQVVHMDALLFLWGTSTHMLDIAEGKTPPVIRVAKAWGFTPKVIVPWLKVSDDDKPSKAKYRTHPAFRRLVDKGIKLHPGNGHYTFAVAEPLIICTRGRAVDLIAERLPNLIVAPRGKHSEKPIEQYAYIQTLTGGKLPSLELFCRGPGRDPFHVWGLEATGHRRVALPGIGKFFGDLPAPARKP